MQQTLDERAQREWDILHSFLEAPQSQTDLIHVIHDIANQAITYREGHETEPTPTDILATAQPIVREICGVSKLPGLDILYVNPGAGHLPFPQHIIDEALEVGATQPLSGMDNPNNLHFYEIDVSDTHVNNVYYGDIELVVLSKGYPTPVHYFAHELTHPAQHSTNPLPASQDTFPLIEGVAEYVAWKTTLRLGKARPIAGQIHRRALLLGEWMLKVWNHQESQGIRAEEEPRKPREPLPFTGLGEIAQSHIPYAWGAAAIATACHRFGDEILPDLVKQDYSALQA